MRRSPTQETNRQHLCSHEPLLTVDIDGVEEVLVDHDHKPTHRHLEQVRRISTADEALEVATLGLARTADRWTAARTTA